MEIHDQLPENPLKLAAFLVAELRGTDCFCGRTKQGKHTFCGRCFRILPFDMKQALYQKLGDGYEDAYKLAVEYLARMGIVRDMPGENRQLSSTPVNEEV